MAREMIVHFVCEVTHKKTGFVCQRGVTVNFMSHDILKEKTGFDFVIMSGAVEGKMQIAATNQASTEDFLSRISSFQIMP